MSTRQTLATFLFLVAFMGAVSGRFMALEASEPALLVGVFEIAMGFLLFSWYYTDSNARAYPRSRWLSIAVVALAWLAIPYYLVRSRPAGQKGRALLRCLGFVVLSLCVAAVAAVLGALL